MYDPEIARFMQEDTYRGQTNDPLSLNLYSYCYNNPIRYWDPTGHVVSEWDRAHLTADEIKDLEKYTENWETGDSIAKAYAHAKAEALRNKYRNNNEIGSDDGYTYVTDSSDSSTAKIYSGDSGSISSNRYKAKETKTLKDTDIIESTSEDRIFTTAHEPFLGGGGGASIDEYIGLRKLIVEYGGMIEWNHKTRTATATLNHITKEYKIDDVNITLRNDRIIVDQDDFFKDFELKDYDTQDILGDWEKINHLGTVNKTFTAEEIRKSNHAENAAMFLIGLVTTGWPAALLTSAKIEKDYMTVNVQQIGGVYTKSYYARKIVNTDEKDLNVPVAYQYKWITIYYDSSEMTKDNMVYMSSMSDGGPRLSSNK